MSIINRVIVCALLFLLSSQLNKNLEDHFHVHILNANYQVGLGMAVGQAHLLDDIIALVGVEYLPFLKTDFKHSLSWTRLRALGSLSV
jgi:hypothetical protein